MLKLLGPLLTFVNRVWKAVTNYRANRKSEKVIEHAEEGRIHTSYTELNEQLRDEKLKKS